jgi:glycosyltransferase involved in cell wall biosynthesis
MARVSIVIPVFNGAATIAEAIDSVLDQRFRDFEIIVVDDGSTDSTAQVLEGYRGRIRVIGRENGGPAAARNAGACASASEYLAFLDADDRWLPEMLSRTVPLLDRDLSCAMAYCNMSLADSNGKELHGALIGKDFAHAPSLDEMLKRMWPIMPSGTVMRRSAFERSGGFCEQFKRASYEDAYFVYLMREQGTFCYVPECLAVWRFSSFPRRLKKSGRVPEAERLFARLIGERYGVDGTRLVKARIKAPRSTLGYIGLVALREGDHTTARSAFIRALRADPFHLKTYFRLARTFLPPAVARKLSGRTQRHREVQADTN